VRLNELPTVGDGEIAHAVAPKDSPQFPQVCQLRGIVADVLDNVIADHDVERAGIERQSRAGHASESVGVTNSASVLDIHGVDVARKHRVRREVVRDTAGACAHLEEPNRPILTC
jgi:hypothetical protein